MSGDSSIVDKCKAAGYNLDLAMCDGVIVPRSMLERTETMNESQLRQDDILLCSYIKSGTHWVWEILNMIVARKAEYVKHWQNSSWLEARTEEDLEELESPRVLHTHLLPRLLPVSTWRQKCKVVNLHRSYKDCVVSRYCQLSSQTLSSVKKPTFTGTWEDFMNIYIDGAVPFGAWFDYELEWNNTTFTHPDVPVCRVYYEDLISDCVQEIKRMAEYLERPLPDKVYTDIAEACCFQNLKHASETVKDQTFHIQWKEGTSGYFRKGAVGDWKNWFTVAQNERFHHVCEEKLGKKVF